MRLSEAILLGSVAVKPARGLLLERWRDGDRGCALGMACKGADVEIVSQTSLWPIHRKWRWTMQAISGDGLCCPHQLFFGSVAQFIAHVFDYHIAAQNPRDPAWTLEQLVDWVRSVEPAEEKTQILGRDPEHSHGSNDVGNKKILSVRT